MDTPVDEPYSVQYVRIDAHTVKAKLSAKNTNDACSSVSNQQSLPTIIVFDVSGSMQIQDRFHNSKRLVNAILARVGQVTLITYNKHAHDHGMVQKLPANLVADGQTSFNAAYNAVLASIKNTIPSLSAVQMTNGQPLVGTIVFMTDGEDTTTYEPRPQLAVFKKKLSELCATHKIAYGIHTVGVDASDADAQLLIELSKAGTIEGTFGALDHNVADIESEVLRLVNVVTGAHRTKIVSFHGQQYAIGNDSTVTVFINDETMICDPCHLLDRVDYAAYQLEQMASNLHTVSVKSLITLRESIHAVFLDAGRPPYTMAEKKQIRRRIQPLNQLLTTIYNTLYSGTNNGNKVHSNAVIASLSIAAREARQNGAKYKSRMARVVVDRSDTNTQILAKEDAAIEAHVNEAKPVPVEQSAQLSQFLCTLTQCDANELRLEGDCVGIGVKVQSDEMCLFNPTRLKVEGVGVGYFSASEFLAMASHAATGGVSFDLSTSVIKDASGLLLSGILPLYINEAHWCIAKHYARRMAAHLCCKDPLMGNDSVTFFTYLQVYQYLQKSLQTHAVAAVRSMTDMIQETIKALYTLNPSVIPLPSTFLTDVSSRLASVLLSPLALCHAYKTLDLAHDATMVECYAVEENVRRQFNSNNTPPCTIKSFFILDRAKLVDPYVRSQVNETRGGGASMVAKRMTSLLSTVSAQYPFEVTELLQKATGKIVREEYMVDEQTGNMIDTGDAHDPLDDVVFQPVDDKSTALPGVLANYSAEKRIMMLLQVSRHLNEADYCAAYKDWHHCAQDNVRSAFMAACIQQVRLERVSAISAIVSSMQNDETAESIACLNNPNTSMLERVACLHGVCYVGRNIGLFAETTTSHSVWRMITNGFYDIAPLIGYEGGPVLVRTTMDRSRHGQSTPIFWSPKRSRAERALRRIAEHRMEQ